MADEHTFESEMAALYEKNTRISIPTYDALFAIVQSYLSMQLSRKKEELLVVGASGGNEPMWGPSKPIMEAEASVSGQS